MPQLSPHSTFQSRIGKQLQPYTDKSVMQNLWYNKFCLRFILTMVALLSTWTLPGHAKAQSSDTIKYRMLMVESNGDPQQEEIRKSLLISLAEKGLIQHQNLLVKHYNMGGLENRIKNIWKFQEQRAGHQVIQINGNAAATVFKDLVLKAGIPVVFTNVHDPVRLGLLENLDTPPAYNFTGVAEHVELKERLWLIRHVLPRLQQIGIIHSDTIEAQEELSRLRTALTQPEFQLIKLHTRSFHLDQSQGGHAQMENRIKDFVLELNSKVDVFITLREIEGLQPAYNEVFNQWAQKPLVGRSLQGMKEHWGAALAIYAHPVGIGEQAAKMVAFLLNGGSISSLWPVWPKSGMALDRKKIQRFDLKPPNLSENNKHFAITNLKEVVIID